MSNYSTKSEKTKSLTNAVDYLHGLLECRFVVLNSKGLPIKSYKKANRIDKTETLAGLDKFGYIGLVPKSIGMWVFVKSNKFCKFIDPDAISYRDSNGWTQYWYAGNIHKSLDIYRCSVDLADKFGYCGRIIQQHEYIILTGKDLINLATKLFNIGLFNPNGCIYDPKDKPEITHYHQKLTADHIKARKRLYKDLTPKEMLLAVSKTTSHNLYPIMRALILEMAIREHERIKSGEINKKYLFAILDKLMAAVKKSLKLLTASEQNKIVDNAYDFAKNSYLTKHDHPKRHFDWINLYRQGRTITDISKQYGVSRSTVSVALDKYGAKN